MIPFDPEIEAVLPLLNDPDPAIRRVGLLQIVDFADESPALFVAATRDVDVGVRLEAAKALEGNPDAEAVRALAVLLDDPDEELVAAAAESLGEILDPAAGPVLIELLAQASGEAMAYLLAALRKLRQPGALGPALALADDPSVKVRREAVGVLAYLKDGAALSKLGIRAGQDADPAVRRIAVGALSFATDTSVLPALGVALGDSDWQVRQEAAVTLGKLLLPESASILIGALDDPAWEVRLKAANALGKLKARSALPGLIGALEHPISNLRKEAAGALGAIGDPAAIPALQKAATEDRDIDVNKTARRALEAIGA